MTTDPREVERFAELAGRWWDPEGPMRPLHLLNPVRIAWIRDRVCGQFGRDPRAPRPFSGLRMLDVGCGAGLLAEPLARLGADVVAIDPAAENVEVARAHAGASGLGIDYRVATAEDLLVRGESFDVVCALEVVEHVPDPAEFVREVAGLVRPGGLALFSTLSRTLSSLLLGVIAAEHVLRWLPPGTHDWRRFLNPSELARLLRARGLVPVALTGIRYDAAHGRFEPARDPSVNYMMAAARPQAS